MEQLVAGWHKILQSMQIVEFLTSMHGSQSNAIRCPLLSEEGVLLEIVPMHRIGGTENFRKNKSYVGGGGGGVWVLQVNA